MSEDGRTRRRFNNFPNHPNVDRHHYHTPDGVADDIEYTGLADHIRQFHAEIDAAKR